MVLFKITVYFLAAAFLFFLFASRVDKFTSTDKKLCVDFEQTVISKIFFKIFEITQKISGFFRRIFVK